MIDQILISSLYDPNKTKPRLFLCKRNFEEICELHEAFNLKIKPTLAGLHELSFDIPYVLMKNGNSIRNPNSKIIRGHYLIRYEEDATIEYFLINQPKKSASSGKEILSVNSYLLPYELKDKMVRSYSGTKKLYDATTQDGVLNETLMAKTDWTVAHIDNSLVSKYRTFDVSQQTLLDFMNTLADTFNAVLIWDTVNKAVSFYEATNIGTDKGFTIEFGKYLKSIDEEPNFDNVVTRLYGVGSNGLSFASTNPTGTEFIEMYDYYMYPFERVANISPTKIKSANIDAWSLTNTSQILSDINTLKLNYVTVPIKINASSATTSTMSVDETDKANAISLIQQLNSKGIKVILEPYPCINNGAIAETDWNPTDINTWFYNWKTIILQELINDVAKPYNVYGLYIASNLSKLEPNTGYWQDVVTYVRGLYNGKVIYRTNWWVTATWDTGSGSTTEAYNNKLNNALFGDVDIIAISAYFELNEDTITSVDQLVTDIHSTRIYNRGQNVYQEVKNFYDTWNKPIIFGELGFPSKELASEQPWNPTPSNTDSQEAQANLFQAYREVFENESWFQGFSVFSIGQVTSNYYPIGKLAQIQIKEWFRNDFYTVNSSSYYMTDELCHAQLDYEDLITDNKSTFSDLLTELTNYQTTLSSQQADLATLESDLAIIQDNLDTANATGEPTDQYITQKAAKQSDIDSKNADINTTQSHIDDVVAQMQTLRSLISVENNFTFDEIIERNDYSLEQVWSDNNYTDPTDLYNQAVINLQKLSQPLFEYSIDIVDFLKVAQCKADWDKLNLGDIVTILYPNLDIEIEGKIITIDRDWDSNGIKLTIANNHDLKSGFYQFKDLVNFMNNTSTSLNMNDYKWSQGATIAGTIEQIINNTWDATKRSILAAKNETVEINNRGIIIKDPNDPNKYIIMQHGQVALTSDNGETWKTAITPEYIVAESIVGKLGSFVKLQADSLVVGDSGAGIPSDVLTVGGTNLISKSMFLSTVTYNMTNSKSGFGYKILKGQTNLTYNIGQLNLQPNTDYMISFVTWSPTTPIQAHVQLSPTTNLPIYPFATTTTPTKVTWKVNSSSADIGNCQLQFYTSGSDDTYITDIKVEQGTLATDWSPSPNDSMQTSTDYNGVQIDPTNGLLVTKSDGTVKTSLNATDGFRIQKKNATTGQFEDKLYIDTDGDINYDGKLTNTSTVGDRTAFVIGASLDGFGNGSDGTFNSTGNFTINVAQEDSTTIIRQYSSFTLNYNHTFTVDKRCRGVFILCQGDVVINGTIDMRGKAAKVSKANSTQRLLQIPAGLPVVDLPQGGVGGNGGKGGNGYGNQEAGTGGTGSSGTVGVWFGGGIGGAGGGGGGCGYVSNLPAPSFNGGNAGGSDIDSPIGTGGTSGDNTNWSGSAGGNFCGGGGSGSNVFSDFSSYSAGGGGGGIYGGSSYKMYGSTKPSDGGSGGSLGGGLLVIIAKGNITINGTINCNGSDGSNGGNGGSGNTGNGGGGGASGGGGGGVIALAYRGTYANNGSLTVNGGSGGIGGGGGSGTSGGSASSGGSGTPGIIGSIVIAKV